MYENASGNKIVHKELSYAIIGAIFEVYNELGYGFKERYYEDAIAKEFERKSIKYKRQMVFDLKYKGDAIGKYRFDFLVEDIIIVELKTGNFYSKQNITQAVQYLKAANLELALLVNMTQHGVKYRRILNIR